MLSPSEFLPTAVVGKPDSKAPSDGKSGQVIVSVHPSRRIAQGRKIRRFLMLFILIVVAVGLLIASPFTRRHAARADFATHTVHYEKLHPTIVAKGDLEPAEATDVVCRVRSWTRNSTIATTIKWVIEEGSFVQPGQLLVELDDSGIQDDLENRRGPLEQSRADWIMAQENYRMVINQNQADLEAANVAVLLAEIDVQKYQKGDYVQALQDLHGRQAQAESDLEMWRDRLAWTELMTKKGFLGATQALADQARLRNAQIAVENLHEEQRVLERYTRSKTVTGLMGALSQARAALACLQIQARAKDAQARVDSLIKEGIYQKRRHRFDEIAAEISKCRLTAPHAGTVVYVVPAQVRSGSGSQTGIVAQGEPVREGQRLLTITNLSKMQVHVHIQEALIAHVHGDVRRPSGFADCLEAALLVTPDPLTRLVNPIAWSELRHRFQEHEHVPYLDGEPASIRVDAFPDRSFRGHVREVAAVASQLESPIRDIRVFETEVAIDEPADGLRPDMTAEVTIQEDEDIDPVLAIPVAALIHTPDQGHHCTCFVETEEGPEARDIVVGRHTDILAEVKAGLREGEEVILHPEPLLADKSRNEHPDWTGAAAP
jgi:multidrug efflux pump subunit AcrA (membrane-fusion protein)